MNSICPMNFFRMTDTTDTTIWKPGLKVKNDMLLLEIKCGISAKKCNSLMAFSNFGFQSNEHLRIYCMVEEFQNLKSVVVV